MQQSTSPSAFQQQQQQSYGPSSTATYTLPRDYVEQELASISQTNQRIREELETARSTGAFEEIPRSVFQTEERPVGAPSTSPATVFGQREGTVKRMWGLEEQIKEDLGENPSIAPLPTRDQSYETRSEPSASAGMQQTSQPVSTPSYGGDSVNVETVGLGYEPGQQEPTVVVISSVQYSEIAAPEAGQTDYNRPTQPTSITEPMPMPKQYAESQKPPASTPFTKEHMTPNIVGLGSFENRTRPLKRVIDIFYDKNSMMSWKANASVFVKWLKASGILHDGDIVRHLTFSPNFQGVLNGSQLDKNEDLLSTTFPDDFPFWLEYFANQIPFEIIFIGPDFQSFKRETEQYPPALLLCPTMPDVRSPAHAAITRDVKVPVMFAH